MRDIQNTDPLEFIASIRPSTDTFSDLDIDGIYKIALRSSPVAPVRLKSARQLAATLGVAAILIAVVAAGILSQSTTSSGPPVLSLTRGPLLSSNSSGAITTSAAGSRKTEKINYQFVAGSAIPNSNLRAKAFTVRSLTDAKSEAYLLASRIHLKDQSYSHYLFTSTSNLPVWNQRIYQIGSSAGPHIMTFERAGVVTWAYQGNLDTSSGGAPSATSSIEHANRLFKKLGVSNHLSVISSSRFGNETTVNFDYQWEGTTPYFDGGPGLSFTFSVTFGPHGYLVDAYGVEVAPLKIGSYDTISALQAVGVLRRSTFDYAVNANSAGSNSTTTTLTSPAERVEISSATLGLSTLVNRANGTMFVPTWYLTGDHKTFSVVAINSHFLDFKSVAPGESQ